MQIDIQRSLAGASVLIAASAGHAQTFRFSQNVDEFSLVASLGIGCASTTAPQTTGDNLWSRSFTLADFGVPPDVEIAIQTVEFGIENLQLPTLLEAEVRVNLYAIPAGSPPLGDVPEREPIGSASITLGDRVLELSTVDVVASIGGDRALMVEIESANFIALGGGETGDVLFAGANDSGQTGPSYIASPDACGLSDPLDLADLGYPESHMLIIAQGIIEGGCRADFDASGALNPFDFLAFRNTFGAGDPRTDFDGDGVLTIFDFLVFVNEYLAGC